MKNKLINLQEGGEIDASIVDVLISPVCPCFVYSKSDKNSNGVKIQYKEIALNYGKFRESHRFNSFIGDFDGGSYAEVYMLNQLMDSKILVKTKQLPREFYKQTLKLFEQRGFCDMLYEGSVDDVLKEFVEQGHMIHKLFSKREKNICKKQASIAKYNFLKTQWEKQRQKKLKKITEKINQFYQIK